MTIRQSVHGHWQRLELYNECTITVFTVLFCHVGFLHVSSPSNERLMMAHTHFFNKRLCFFFSARRHYIMQVDNTLYHEESVIPLVTIFVQLAI